MKIDALDIYHVRMDLIQPWRTAYGEDRTIESLLVRMEAEGQVAWGESCPLQAPTYSTEWAGGAFDLLVRWLAPAVVGQTIDSGEELQARWAQFKGNPFAKAAIDVAWWVLAAQLKGQPLHRFLGATRDAAPVGADFGVLDSIPELLAAIRQAVADKYRRVKLKFRPGWDLDMLRAVRQEFPTLVLHVDLNNGYRLDRHAELLCRLDDFQLAMIEQPLSSDDLIDHARLQQMIRTPVCLDESICSVDRADVAIDLGSCRYVNIKPARVGGLTPAIAIHNACRAAGIPCWVGGMLESAVGVRIAAALAMLDNFTYPADIFASDRFYAQDLARPIVTLDRDAEGCPEIRLSATPGTGAEPDPERLPQATIAHARIAR